MKKHTLPNLLAAIFLLTILIVISCSNKNDDENTENVLSGTDYDITPILYKFNNIEGLSYEIRGDNVVITTDNLPDHKSPYWEESHDLYEEYNGTNPNWHQNPNTIASQNIVFTIPLKPIKSSTVNYTGLGPIGVSLNGVVFYNQYAGPNNQPLTNEIDSFDQYFGHPQNSGQYHYHIEPTYLTGAFGKSSVLGLLADGFPVYGSEENGLTVTNSDLDEYHGHTSATDDFPNGIYHYHITSEDPYINGNGYYGTPGSITR